MRDPRRLQGSSSVPAYPRARPAATENRTPSLRGLDATPKRFSRILTAGLGVRRVLPRSLQACITHWPHRRSTPRAVDPPPSVLRPRQREVAVPAGSKGLSPQGRERQSRRRPEPTDALPQDDEKLKSLRRALRNRVGSRTRHHQLGLATSDAQAVGSCQGGLLPNCWRPPGAPMGSKRRANRRQLHAASAWACGPTGPDPANGAQHGLADRAQQHHDQERKRHSQTKQGQRPQGRGIKARPASADEDHRTCLPDVP